jgi:hypothetical protein
MRPEDLAGLPNYSGIYFDPMTGKTYLEDGSDTGYTFERARWSGPFGIDFSWPWLNPISFATAETGQKVLTWARAIAPATLAVTLDDRMNIVGPFTRTVERLIVITDMGGRSESFSAGWLANSIIRHGEKAAAGYFQAEWRSSGSQF